MTPLTCREIIDEFLSDYVEGRLPAATRAALEYHLTRCPDCVHYLHSFRTTLQASKEATSANAAAEAIPESLVQAILAARQS